ncbi:MAG: tRNA (adenosine(37)-N6)-threonylcarbamoyltransferase complex ATPase subunit type 1 TsaE [Nitrospiraceae bacterium]|jgi:tRNA threonylcarbamoyladenosine biosynthesis protein TsaE|nr:tRNA (adenosine(37)-N6)-threonylcarbamoyltransferase complex ATPase subunit type 1 TsaE [Nitrospiraceae bacterium]
MNFGSHETTGPDQTRHIGNTLGKTLSGGEVLAITGDLGAGKTCLIQGIAQGLGIASSDITSPTFTLIHEHEGRIPLFHIDLYRLEKPTEVEAIGLEEYFSRDGVTAIEWAERATPLLPQNRVDITLSHEGGNNRRITITKKGEL